MIMMIITENVNTPHEAVKTQTPFPAFLFDVKNIGLTQAKEVKVSVDAGDKILPKSLNVAYHQYFRTWSVHACVF